MKQCVGVGVGVVLVVLLLLLVLVLATQHILALFVNSLQELISGLVLELTGGYVFLGTLVPNPQKETWLVAKD